MTHDPQTIAWLDQEDAHLAQVIRAHRWSVQYVGAGDEPDEPAVRLHRRPVRSRASRAGASSGSGRRRTHSILSRVAGMVADGRDLVAGELLAWPDWPDLRLVVEELPNPGEVVLGATASTSGPTSTRFPPSSSPGRSPITASRGKATGPTSRTPAAARYVAGLTVARGPPSGTADRP